jgi:dUTPase
MFKTINGGKLPTKATKFSAAVDLYANADVVIKAGETYKVPLGVCIDEEKMKDMFKFDCTIVDCDSIFYFADYEKY